MTGTLNLYTRTPLRFSPENRSFPGGAAGSDRKVSFLGNRKLCKAAAVHAFADTETAAVDTRRPAAASLYEVLRVNRSASATEIKTAYRNLAKRYHPDAAPCESDGRDFMRIHSAYATLSDPSARALYDLSLGGARRSYSGAGHRSGFYPTRRWETDQCW
ncbi:hypothetical protein RJ639_015184 [Escallonia herrerae]|uniref:J domain-containing protein n=1 Tax=Escallonia herrerae TaxID=1293975 RepID=A0AA89ANY8_9ASTE|nr:hypothetical protein RJ639_015184 [Escallonia herrerae]